jgi:hypothetical protein
VPGTAVASLRLVLRLTQCLHDALRASCGSGGRNRRKALSAALSGSDTASGRSLLRIGHLTQDFNCARNRCSDRGARAVANSVPPRCASRSVRSSRSKSVESTASAPSTSDAASSHVFLCRVWVSDAASSRLLLRPGYPPHEAGRARNRRSGPGTRAAAWLSTSRCTFGSLSLSRSKLVESTARAPSASDAA